MHNRYRYSQWDGTQNSPELDGSKILEEIADDLIYHGDISAALKRLMRQGIRLQDGSKIPGIKEILQRVLNRKLELQRKTSENDFFKSIQQELSEILKIENNSLQELINNTQNSLTASDQTALDALKLRQIELATLPDFLPDKLAALSKYDFTSLEAHHRFEQLIETLKKEILDAHFKGISESLKNLTEKDINRIREALSNLNKMIEQHLDNQPLDPTFEQFMKQYGDLFPGNPKNLEELITNLAQQSALLSSVVASMSPEQQAILQGLSSQLMNNMDLAFETDRLAANLRKMLPSLNWDQPNFDNLNQGFPSLSNLLSNATELAFLNQLEKLLSQTPTPNLLKELDWDQIRRYLGNDTERALKALSQLADILKKEGLIEQKGQKLSLSPKAIRKLGGSVLDKIFKSLKLDKPAGHQLIKQGLGTDYLGTSKLYEFGAPFDIDLTTTLYKAVSRDGKGTPVKISANDFYVKERDSLTRASTVVMIDLSLSMPMRENFLPAKKVALAIYHLIKQRFPKDYVGIVGFSEVAHEIKPEDLPSASWDFVYGTNIAHGLSLSRRLLANKQGTKQIIMITDGEPTAHIMKDGNVFFSYPPTSETLKETLLEVARCTKKNITINSFVLDANPYLVSFINKLAEINEGRVFYVTPDNLEQYVLIDFLNKDTTKHGNGRSFYNKYSRQYFI